MAGSENTKPDHSSEGTESAEARPARATGRRLVALAAACCILVLLGIAVIALWPDQTPTSPGASEANHSSPDEPPVKSFSHPTLEAAWGALNEGDDVIHVVAHIEHETHEGAPEDYVVPVVTSKVEIWEDAERGIMRKSRLQAVGDGWISTQEELVQGPIWTIYQIGMTGPDTYEPMNVLRYDADKSDQRPDSPFTVEADLAAYRASLATGTAEYAGRAVTNGQRVYLIRYRLDDSSYSRETTVHVSETTNLPVRTDVTRWYFAPDGNRQLAERGSVVFEVSEALSREDVPERTFELEYPDTIPVITRLTLDLERARHAEGVAPLWLGTSYNDLELAEAIPYSSTTGVAPLLRFEHGPPHGLTAADASAELGDYVRPRLDGPWITLEYGEMGGPNIRISSVPATSAAAWEEGFRGQGAWTTLDGGRAYSAIRTYQFVSNGFSMGSPDRLEHIDGATRAEYRFLVVGEGNSTVILQGYRVSEDELKEAARRLKPLD